MKQLKERNNENNKNGTCFAMTHKERKLAKDIYDAWRVPCLEKLTPPWSEMTRRQRKIWKQMLQKCSLI